MIRVLMRINKKIHIPKLTFVCIYVILHRHKTMILRQEEAAFIHVQVGLGPRVETFLIREPWYDDWPSGPMNLKY
jgi:hypothetical protein